MISILYILLGVLVILLLLEFFFLSRRLYLLGAFRIVFRFIYKPGLIKFEKSKVKVREKESFWVFAIALFLCIGIIISEFVMKSPETGIINYFGALIILIGGIIKLYAQKALGKYFTFRVMIQPKHKLIQKSIYKKVRHPNYLSAFLILIGAGLALSSWFGLVFVFILFIPATIFRISKEEEMLINEFKNKYIKYMETTKKLIPYVY